MSTVRAGRAVVGELVAVDSPRPTPVGQRTGGQAGRIEYRVIVLLASLVAWDER